MELQTLTTLATAQAYVARGWSAIPIRPHDKKPLEAWKEFQTRYATDAELRAWFEGTENNVGVVAGQISNLTIVDCDSQDAIEFFESRDFAPTLKVMTAHGCHYYYRFVEGSGNFQAKKEWPGIDLRSEGGYVVGPPSIHPSGIAYEWVNDLPIAQAPAWLFESSPQLDQDQNSTAPPQQSTEDLYASCSEGGRNMALTRLAGSLLVSNATEKTLQICQLWNKQNTPPLPDAELKKTVLSVSEKEEAGKQLKLVEVVDWQEPVVFGARVLPDIPLDRLPAWLRHMIESVAASTETPAGLAAMLGLCALATATQRTFEVKIKQGYIEPLNVWIMTGLESGTRKTAVLAAMTSPLEDYDRKRSMDTASERQRIASERKTSEARISRLRKKAAGVDDKIEYQAAAAEITTLEVALPVISASPQLWQQDITPEALGSAMEAQGGVLSLLSDEGGMLETFGGRYSNGIPNVDLANKAHAGSPFRSARASRDPIDIQRPTLTIGLTPQPSIIRGLLKKPELRGTGFLARFLYLLPVSLVGYRPLQHITLSTTVSEQYSAALHQLLAIAPLQDSDGNPIRHQLQLSDEAHHEWKDYAKAVEYDLRDGERFEHLKDWGGKLLGAAARVAGLLHCAEYYERRPQDHEITKETMASALEIMVALEEHALAAFELMKADPGIEDGKKIWAWIVRNGEQTFSHRDCHNGLQGSFPRADRLTDGLGVLIERGYIRPLRPSKEPKKPGRPSQKYEVNPALEMGGE